MSKDAGRKADIWSFGVSIFELGSLRHPFAGAASQAALVVRIMAAQLPPPPRRYSAPLGRMLQACMQKQPAHRPSALQLLTHPRTDFLGAVFVVWNRTWPGILLTCTVLPAQMSTTLTATAAAQAICTAPKPKARRLHQLPQ